MEVWRAKSGAVHGWEALAVPTVRDTVMAGGESCVESHSYACYIMGQQRVLQLMVDRWEVPAWGRELVSALCAERVLEIKVMPQGSNFPFIKKLKGG